MPQASLLIKTQLETTEEYLTRRIRWVEDSFRRELTIPTRHAFSRRAQIRHYVADGNVDVCLALEDALLRSASDLQEPRK
jgi:hypothetical protein